MALRRVLLTGAALILAAMAWRDAATAYWLEVAPQSAPSLVRSDIRFALAGERLTLLQPVEQPVPLVRTISAKSRQSLLREPLDPIALRQIGLARMWLEEDGGEAFLALAQRLSRREIGTQVALFNLAAARADYPAALDHLDLAFMQYPQIGGDLLPYLVPMLNEPAFQRALQQYRRRAWVSWLMSVGVDNLSDPIAVARAMTRLDIPTRASDPTFLSRLIEKLIGAGHFPAARRVAIDLGHASPESLERFGFSTGTIQPTVAPLTWDLAESDLVRSASDGDDGISVEIEPTSTALVAQRVTFFPAGLYRLSHKIERHTGTGSPTFEWHLGCAEATGAPRPAAHRVFAMRSPSARIGFDLRLPESCLVQYWQLRARSGEDQFPLRFGISDLQLRHIR